MAVPTPPTAGEPIAEAWGDVVHDQVVAMEFQAGVVSGMAASGAAVTFPHPFASPPVVTVSLQFDGTAWSVAMLGNAASVVSATGFTVFIRNVNGAAAIPGTTQVLHWIAYGPRA